MEILVDRDGYEQFMDVFEKLKNSMNDIATSGSEEYRNAVGMVGMITLLMKS